MTAQFLEPDAQPRHMPLFTDSASLRDYVLLVAGTDVDPYRIAEKVLSTLTHPEEFRVLAEATFAPWIWGLLKHPTSGRKSDGDKGQPVRAYIDGNGIRRASARQVAFLDAYQRLLTRAVKVGDAVGDRKHFGECTTDDLAWMADYRHRVADANKNVATKYVLLATTMREKNATTVADLDRDELLTIMGE